VSDGLPTGGPDLGVNVRARLLLAAAALVSLSGCGAERDAQPPVDGSGANAPEIIVPAASAGGACRWLDFDVIEQATGTRFTIAAAQEQRRTSTCVVRTAEATHPDLAFSVTRAGLDVETFQADIVPAGAGAVKGLGQAGYKLVRDGDRRQGATSEVGWLDAKGQLRTLRYTLPVEATAQVAKQHTAGLITLAQQVETATG